MPGNFVRFLSSSARAVALTMLAVSSVAVYPPPLVAWQETSPVVSGQQRLLKEAPFRAAAPDQLDSELSLSDVWGKSVVLSDIWTSDYLVVLVMGTECPLARLYVGRFEELASEFQTEPCDFLLLDANVQDSLTELQRFQTESGSSLPLVKDVGQRFADRLTAIRTPEAFVMNRQGDVIYRGRVDDQYQVGLVRNSASREDLRIALRQQLADESIESPNTSVQGCFIGRSRADSESSEGGSELTYSQHIAPMLNRHCVECHREGDIGPMPLVDYDEVAAWSETILEVVQDHRMPPWHAANTPGTFRNERQMTTDEIGILERWVQAGSPAGDLSETSAPPEFSSHWRMESAPDQVIAMSGKPFSVPAQGVIEYQYYVVDPGWTEDRWIRAAQVLPGDTSVVHHCIVFVRTPDTTRFDGLGWLGGYVPGQSPMMLEPGQARLIPAGSKLVFQMHYTPVGRPREDLTKIGVWFADEEDVTEQVVTAFVLNKDFEIPPHASAYRVTSSISGFPPGSRLLALTPHMHVRGESIRVWQSQLGESIDPEQATPLLDVPFYDFNWQHSYEFAQPIELEPETKITFEAVFNNSDSNPVNPDPNVAVRWGDQTWQEMAIVFINLTVPRDASFVWERTQSEAESLSAKEKARRCLARFDHNGDGYIQRREAPEAFAAFAFSRFDQDNDNRLSLQELSGQDP